MMINGFGSVLAEETGSTLILSLITEAPKPLGHSYQIIDKFGYVNSGRPNNEIVPP